MGTTTPDKCTRSYTVQYKLQLGAEYGGDACTDLDDDVKNVFSSTIYSLGISRDP